MADSKDVAEVAQTIVYLRPHNPETISLLDRDDNELFQYTLGPPPKPTNQPLEEISDNRDTSHPVVPDVDPDDASRETTPGFYSPCPKVFRLRFDSTEKPSPSGFKFGSGPNSKSRVKVPYYRNKRKDGNLDYFRVHYNFNSGALLITAIDGIQVGSLNLMMNQSLLLMPNTNIKCGGIFDFIVEFPNLSDCIEEHEHNYLQYAAKLGILDAQYVPTPVADDMLIGHEHLSKGILGKGAFGEVHKAIDMNEGQLFAIKILKNGGEAEMREVDIMCQIAVVSGFGCN